MVSTGGAQTSVDAQRGERLEIAIEAPRIGGKVLVRRELRRIDEDRDHDPARPPPAASHQGEVARVQRPHGRYQRDALVRTAELGDGAAQCRDGAQDARATGHDPLEVPWLSAAPARKYNVFRLSDAATWSINH